MRHVVQHVLKRLGSGTSPSGRGTEVTSLRDFKHNRAQSRIVA
jgi:hypothetical protein